MHADLHCDHAPLLVALSYTISVLGAYCALQWASLIGPARGWQRARRVGAAALAMGGGAIWSMHFIGMLACRLPAVVAYDVPLTVLSMMVAVTLTGAGLYVIAAAPSSGLWLTGSGTVAGLGVAAMHYTGMAAMRLPARVSYDPWLVAASVAIAIVAAIGAFAIAFRAVGRGQRWLGALVMGGAVCGMHYTAMAAAAFHTTAARPPASGAVASDALGVVVFGATLFVLLLLGSVSRVVRREGEVLARSGALTTTNEQLRIEVAERARVESALRESEARSRGIIETSLDAVVTMDEHGVITEWNPQAELMFGWARAEAVGRSLAATIIPPGYRDAHDRGLRRYVETGQANVLNTRIEVAALHRSGREFQVELAITAIPSAGRPSFCGFIRDITERRRAEAALRDRTVYLNTLIEHSPLGIVARDADFRITVVNPAFTRLFQYTEADVVGADLDELIGAPREEDGDVSAAELTRRVRDGETIHVTTRRRRKDGVVLDVELYGVPLIAHGRLIGTFALYQDISERRQLQTQLLHSQKIEAVGTLAGGVAHDFNNLLTTILGYSEELLRVLPEDNPLRNDVDEIRRAGLHAESLTRQLLAFSRKQLAVLEVLDLAGVVRDMQGMLRRLVGPNIEIVTEAIPDGWVKVDRGQIEQVLMNLVLNARDAMPGGGRVTIAVGEESRPAGRHVTLSVSDTGTGIDADTRPRVFEPFFSTKEKGHGTGLGLSTAYGIVKQSGGEIDVDSEPGRGARFTIWLPAAGRPAPAAPKRPAAPLSGGTETILVIDDEPRVRKIARTLLTRNGYHVIEASDGDEGFAATQSGTHIDLVLTDAVMPGMPVGQLISEIRGRLPGTKVMIMSGYTSELMVRRGILEADIPFLQKPFTTVALLTKVREVLGEAERQNPAAPPPGGTL